jgi:hypothetical protein
MGQCEEELILYPPTHTLVFSSHFLPAFSQSALVNGCSGAGGSHAVMNATARARVTMEMKAFTVLPPSFRATYYKAAGRPHLILRERTKTADHELLAEALQAAVPGRASSGGLCKVIDREEDTLHQASSALNRRSCTEGSFASTARANSTQAAARFARIWRACLS